MQSHARTAMSKICANHATATAPHMQVETPFSVHNCAGLIWTKTALDNAGHGKCGAQYKT